MSIVGLWLLYANWRVWNRREKVFDDGDALVVSRRGKPIRIPFDQITRVGYKPQGRRVNLEFVEPNELGGKFSFSINEAEAAYNSSNIADDLHRRSRCCKTAAMSGHA